VKKPRTALSKSLKPFGCVFRYLLKQSCWCRKKWGSARRSNRPHVPHATIAIQAPYSSHDWFRDKDFLKREYLELQKSTAQIAREIGCARSTVVKYLLEFSIELRRDGLPANYRKSQLGYGERIHNAKVVPHLSELRIIEAMAKQRRDGATYAELAQWANCGTTDFAHFHQSFHCRFRYRVLCKRGGISVDLPKCLRESTASRL
jgi:hypothetical protein